MARPFPLANLLRLRQLQEEQAAADLARANAERARAEARRQETADMLAGAAMPTDADPLTWRAAVAARASLGSLTTEAVAALEARRVAAEGATTDWSAARRDSRALEILADRHEVEQRKEDERVEQLALDETSLRRAAPAPTTTEPGETRS